MPAITKIHWDEVPLTAAPPGFTRDAQVFAVWPSPVSADACFETAGFSSFADTDQNWDREFRELLSAVLQALESHARLMIRQDIQLGYGFWERILITLGLQQPPAPLSLIERLESVCFDDHLRYLILDFDSGDIATVIAGNGHPILWMGLRSGGATALQTFLTTLAGGRPLENTPLNWTVLGGQHALRGTKH